MLRPLVLFSAMAALAGSLWPTAGQADDTRQVSGALTYMQRIALPPTARAEVQAKGRFGVVLGETEIRPDGQQVPLAFELTLPTGLSGTVTALIKVGDDPRWILRDAAFAAGEDDLALGELRLSPFAPLAFAKEFDCGDRRVSIGMRDDTLTLRTESRDIPLEKVTSASGARYRGVSAPDTEIWSKGDTATVTLDGARLPECREATPPAERPYRAGGNEPGWRVDLKGDTVEVVSGTGAQIRRGPRPEARAVPGAYAFDMPGLDARLRIEERLCHDDMSGMPHPDTARLTLGARDVHGCGGDPADLLTGKAWRITALGDADLIEPERLSLSFLDEGRVAGNAGCNSITGGFTLSGEGLRFGQMASTMMACPEPLMTQERRLLDAFEKVAMFDMDESGSLRLLAADRATVLLEAERSR